MCSRFLQQEGAGASGSDKWSGQPENWLTRYPPRRSCAVPFKFFSWPGGGPIYDGRGTVVLLECAFDGFEVSLFQGVCDLDGPFGGIARYVYAHLRPYVGFIIRRTPAVPNHGERSLHNESFHSQKSKCSASFSVSVVLAVAST